MATLESHRKKVRVNITLDPKLHKRISKAVGQRGFSPLVETLLEKEYKKIKKRKKGKKSKRKEG